MQTFEQGISGDRGSIVFVHMQVRRLGTRDVQAHIGSRLAFGRWR